MQSRDVSSLGADDQLQLLEGHRVVCVAEDSAPPYPTKLPRKRVDFKARVLHNKEISSEWI